MPDELGKPERGVADPDEGIPLEGTPLEVPLPVGGLLEVPSPEDPGDDGGDPRGLAPKGLDVPEFERRGVLGGGVLS